MTAVVIPFPTDRAIRTEIVEAPHPEFGWCPDCTNARGLEVMNLGREHYGICKVHRTKWHVGSNLFSGWRDETATQRAQAAHFLAGCRDVSDSQL